MLGAVVETTGADRGGEPRKAAQQLLVQTMRGGVPQVSFVAAPARGDVAQVGRCGTQRAAVDVALLPSRERGAGVGDDAAAIAGGGGVGVGVGCGAGATAGVGNGAGPRPFMRRLLRLRSSRGFVANWRPASVSAYRYAPDSPVRSTRPAARSACIIDATSVVLVMDLQAPKMSPTERGSIAASSAARISLAPVSSADMRGFLVQGDGFTRRHPHVHAVARHQAIFGDQRVRLGGGNVDAATADDDRAVACCDVVNVYGYTHDGS